MQRTGLYDKVGEKHIFPDSKNAVAALIDRIHKGTDLPEAGCGNCPLQQYIPVEATLS